MAAVALANVVPTPETWGGAAPLSDVDVQVTARWGAPLEREWSLQGLTFDAAPSTVLNLRASLRNSLSVFDFLSSFTSDARDVRFTLADQSGRVLASEVESTGAGSAIGSENPVRMTFRKVPVGTYVLSAAILDETGGTLAQAQTTLVLADTGARP